MFSPELSTAKVSRKVRSAIAARAAASDNLADRITIIAKYVICYPTLAIGGGAQSARRLLIATFECR